MEEKKIKRYIFSRISIIEDYYEVMAESAEEAFNNVKSYSWLEQEIVEQWGYRLEEVEDVEEGGY